MVSLISYGAKHNHELDGVDKVFSCHYINNPYNTKGLQEQNGLDESIQVFVWRDKNAKYMYKEAILAVEEGAGTLAFECFGGRHRSVAMVEIVAEGLRDLGYRVNINHLSLGVSYEAR